MTEPNRRRHEEVWSTLERITLRTPYLARAAEILGGVASYTSWQQDHGFKSIPRYFRREQMWRSAFNQIRVGKVNVVELGVAAGYTTRFWLSNVANPQLIWHGFDVFTGLPEAWRRGGIEFSPEGSFSTGGQPPAIEDSRLNWHIGLVEETLPQLELDQGARLVVLFDLDLYHPTAFALSWLTPRLKPGDLLYFDEVYDPWHERRVLDEFLEKGHRIRPLGSTGLALLMEYNGSPTASSAAVGPRD